MPINFTNRERNALLTNLGKGRKSAIGAKKLAFLLGFPIGSNQVRLRSLIKECIEVDDDLIGAATGKPAGFFIVATIMELEEYLDSLERRTKSDNTRRTALINSWNMKKTNKTMKKTLIVQ